MKQYCILFFIIVTHLTLAQKNTDFRIHSHNDYYQSVPFWKGVSAGASSVEVDVFLIGDSLYVAHSKQEIVAARTFEKLYLEPMQKLAELGLQRPENLQLLIDIKSEAYTTLDAIVKNLKKYPELIHNQAFTFVISGNRPKPIEYNNYPDFILFDYQGLEAVKSQDIRDKIAMVSLSFRNFSGWNGKGRLTAVDLEKVATAIQKAKSLGKPFRFWGTPDSKTAWNALLRLGVDFINTDQPFDCAQYLNSLMTREHTNTVFSEVYRPTFASDGKRKKAKNIILLIGDGNGLAQISATALANKGELSLTQLRNIGFLKTQSSDDFTTDSAGGATAIATGKKVPNRAIGVDADGNSLKNITEILADKGFISGIVTNDGITGATPASFYAHQKDRGMTQEIKNDLLKSNLSFFVSSASNLEQKKRIGHFNIVDSLRKFAATEKQKLAYFLSQEEASSELPIAVSTVLNYLEQKDAPFFLMVEGAKIDSYGHANDIGGVIKEGITFDQVISKVLRFADEDKNTLVIITADHETGGLALPQGNVLNNEIEGDFTTDDHTGIMVPIFAYGPSSTIFRGVYENSELLKKMLCSLGFLE
ncbi:Alkaline phosphatase [Croceitalea dokdonensis DOKDO 023]|uniref:Alkaline phosphatase n=1 Tax=Croceitalea dokdonensis DOKDO 023 TaxID=1300341 RepID=A0A0P7AW46_9FLAO|nr:alkaline phosphatase [Croceitalea dokdonensis]KPM32181.1 Alkaline phosphatase [Croceitalea dokdonensis DOKDO 023]